LGRRSGLIPHSLTPAPSHSIDGGWRQIERPQATPRDEPRVVRKARATPQFYGLVDRNDRVCGRTGRAAASARNRSAVLVVRFRGRQSKGDVPPTHHENLPQPLPPAQVHNPNRARSHPAGRSARAPSLRLPVRLPRLPLRAGPGRSAEPREFPPRDRQQARASWPPMHTSVGQAFQRDVLDESLPRTSGWKA
jgi:hypothetical protein